MPPTGMGLQGQGFFGPRQEWGSCYQPETQSRLRFSDFSFLQHDTLQRTTYHHVLSQRSCQTQVDGLASTRLSSFTSSPDMRIKNDVDCSSTQVTTPWPYTSCLGLSSEAAMCQPDDRVTTPPGPSRDTCIRDVWLAARGHE